MIGFGFISGWMTKWHKFFKPIAKHTCISAKPKQKQMQMLSALE